MSLKRVLETLAGFGLDHSDARVYVFLAKKGPHTGNDIATALTIPKHQLYQCLRNLKNKGIVNATVKRPALFSAVPFEEAIDLLVKAKLEEAQHTQQDNVEALRDWKFIMENHTNKQTKS